MTQKVPQWPFRILRWFCPPQLLEEIEGDLLQQFYNNVRSNKAQNLSESASIRRASVVLAWHIIRYFRPGIILRNKLPTSINPFSMIGNYLTVGLRVIARNRAFSIMNIAGLTLGMTGALLLGLWIMHEYSYDRFHHDGDRLYVAWNRAMENGQINCWSTTPRVLAPTLAKDYSRVEHAVSYAAWGSTYLFTVGEKKLLKTTGVFTDPQFLQMFTFPVIAGDPATALDNPNSIVITKDFARQLFGVKNAFGETLTISHSGHSFDFIVTAILKDLPANTDFKFEYIIPFGFLESIGEKDTFWGNNSVTTLVKLLPDTDLDVVNAQIKDVEKNHYADGQHIEIFLYPFSKMRLYSKFENGVPAGGRIEVVGLLCLLAICLIAIASINFINLSTARAQKRAKEVAVRKVTGANRDSIVFQFLCESILIALAAGIVSIVASWLLLPYFNELTGQKLSLSFHNTTFWLGSIAVIFATGFLAGIYPAFYISAFQPIGILKGINSKSGKTIFRTMLVSTQFGFAILLIVAAMVVRDQINFVQNRHAGYSRENLLWVPLTGDLTKKFSAFKAELASKQIALSVTKSSTPITEQWSSTGGIQWQGKAPDDRTDFERICVDDNFVTTAGLQLILGRDMDLAKFPSDSTAVLLNERAWRVMKFENPLGEVIRDAGHDWHVIGVVKDFVFTSPYRTIEPIVMFGSKMHWAFGVAYVKLNPAMPVREAVDLLAKTAIKYNPDYPFEYHFADYDYQRKFDDLKTTLKITTVFTSVSIVIACLGLLGLVTYMVESRTKEIGIRKVLGGSVLNITGLLGYTSLRPIIISTIIFAPLSWYGASWWLSSFTYQISLSLWTFVSASALIVALAMVTISIQTISAARSNPVESLKVE